MEWVNAFDILVYTYYSVLVFLLGFIVGWFARKFIVKPLPTLSDAIAMHTISMRDNSSKR